jgi:ATP-dependent Clp protease ATP-binding subunit ClpA
VREEKKWRSGDAAGHGVVDEGVIAEVLAQATGIPVFKLTEEESARLVFMEKALHQRVIGQEAAVMALSKSIRRTRAGLKDPKRPIGSFVFEITGSGEKIDAFVNLMVPLGLAEVSRTGIVAIARGEARM